MVDAESLTQNRFLEELRERVDALRLLNVEVPERIDAAVVDVIASDNPFEMENFRLAAAHLLDGIDPNMADADGAVDLLANRLYALPDNLRLAFRVAAERHEQPV
jgi:hypothetical protein